jgi:hypothetical protein
LAYVFGKRFYRRYRWPASAIYRRSVSR